MAERACVACHNCPSSSDPNSPAASEPSVPLASDTNRIFRDVNTWDSSKPGRVCPSTARSRGRRRNGLSLFITGAMTC